MAALRADFQEVRAVTEEPRQPVHVAVAPDEQLGLF
jgi:hypothetical protein